MEQLLQRPEWQAQMRDRHVSRDMAPGLEGPVFVAPKRLELAEDDLTLTALRYIIAEESLADGTMDQGLAASSQWNVLVGGPDAGGDHAIFTDTVLADFLDQRAAEVMAAIPRIEAEYKDALAATKEGVLFGISMGYIPEAVADRIDSLDKTAVQVVDGALLQDGRVGRTEALYGTDDKIQIAHDVSTDSTDFRVIVGHEGIHKLAGASFRTIGSNILVRTRIGLNHTGRYEAMDEVITQHVILGALTGDFETLDPDKRADKDMIYYAERKLLAAIVDRSDGKLEARTLTRALFEDTEALEGTFTDRRALVSSMREAYGPGALYRFSFVLKEAEGIDFKNPDAMQQLQALIDRIQPGSINTEGIQPGHH